MDDVVKEYVSRYQGKLRVNRLKGTLGTLLFYILLPAAFFSFLFTKILPIPAFELAWLAIGCSIVSFILGALLSHGVDAELVRFYYKDLVRQMAPRLYPGEVCEDRLDKNRIDWDRLIIDSYSGKFHNDLTLVKNIRGTQAYFYDVILGKRHKSHRRQSSDDYESDPKYDVFYRGVYIIAEDILKPSVDGEIRIVPKEGGSNFMTKIADGLTSFASKMARAAATQDGRRPDVDTMPEVELENAEFNSAFVLQATNPETCRRLFTSDYAQRFLEACRKYKLNLSILFHDNDVMIYTKDCHLLHNVRFVEEKALKMNIETIRKNLADIAALPRLIDELLPQA